VLFLNQNLGFVVKEHWRGQGTKKELLEDIMR